MDLTLAYLDAGSGALILQLVVGGAAGIAAFVKFRWRSLTGKVNAAPETATASTTAGGSTDQQRSDEA